MFGTLLVNLIWYLALGLPRRRTSRQKRKSVATMKRNAAAARNENTAIDWSFCPS